MGHGAPGHGATGYSAREHGMCFINCFLLNQVYWEPGVGCVPEWSLVGMCEASARSAFSHSTGHN